MNSTPSSERTVYFDMSPAPTPTAEVPPLAPLPNTTQPDPALAPLHAPVPVAGQAAPAHETPARINSVSPAMPEPQTEAELAEARDTVDPNDMPQPSRISPTSTPPPNGHARSASVGRAPSIGRASVFTNTDGQTVGGSTFINGAGTTGPSASVERNESLHQRAASADATFSEQQKARITKNGSKSNKQLAKIIKTEAKVEKKALNLALKELGELQKIQKTAVKREAKAQSAYTHTLSAFQKHEAAFLAARAKYEASQSLLTSTTETLEVSRNNAKEATASLQEKSTEVDGLRQIFDVDEREREVKMVELTGKPTTKSRWSIMG
ncbi:hypothetical protein C8R47DRAFT_966361 [Mycena vitilis]|nr:hypothetical protein C8R47DRAFT_966361 [Mycena vitilis]